MEPTLREHKREDITSLAEIWNAVVVEGNAFPQIQPMTLPQAEAFFAEQSFTGVAEEEGELLGLYILHPNNVGRCGHIANASYAVKAGVRGRGVGEKLVRHSMETAASLGFRILQFNAVVAHNQAALGLYQRLGFTRLGVIPGGFQEKDGSYADIIPHYISLTNLPE